MADFPATERKNHPVHPWGPHRLWIWSTRLDRAGHKLLARVLKTANVVLFRAFLPPEVALSDDVTLGHLGFGVVIHRHTTIGARVHLWQGVMLVSDAGDHDNLSRIVIGNDVEIGAGAIVVNRGGRTLSIGDGARIGAGAVVTRDVPPGATVVSQQNRILLRNHTAVAAALPETEPNGPNSTKFNV